MANYPKMKVDRTYIDASKMLGVLSGELPHSTVVGFAYDGNDEAWVAFVATDRETREPLTFGAENSAFGLNWRKRR